MNKLMVAAIGMVACSVVTGCMTESDTKGGTYANLPDPTPDEYQIHWDKKDERVEKSATVYGGWFGFCCDSDRAPWMLRDKEAYGFFGLIRRYTIEDKARNAALFKACESEKCDALLGTTYHVETEGYGPFFSKSTCKVKGWPATITGIEKVVNKAK